MSLKPELRRLLRRRHSAPAMIPTTVCCLLLLFCCCTAPLRLRPAGQQMCLELSQVLAARTFYKATGQITIAQKSREYQFPFVLESDQQSQTCSARFFSPFGQRIASIAVANSQATIIAGSRQINVPAAASLDSVAAEIPFAGSVEDFFALATGAVLAQALPVICNDTGMVEVAFNGRRALVRHRSAKKKSGILEVQLIQASPVHIMYFYEYGQGIQKISVSAQQNTRLEIVYDKKPASAKQ